MTTPATTPVEAGRLPAPRDPLESARLALARAMLYGAAPLDQVTFRAGCPACGADCDWYQCRVETRLQIRIDCDCRPGPARS